LAGAVGVCAASEAAQRDSSKKRGRDFICLTVYHRLCRIDAYFSSRPKTVATMPTTDAPMPTYQ